MAFYIEDFIKDTVNRIRTSGNISSIVKSTNTYTINTNTTLNLTNGLFVEFDGCNEIFQVSNVVKNKSFQVTSQKTLIGKTVWTMALYFMYGSPDEIRAILSEKNSNLQYKYKKYPLICLFLPISERKDNSEVAITEFENISIAIVIDSNVTYTSEQRKEISFKPILEPLYELFMNALRTSPYTSYLIVPTTKFFSHTKTNYYYYASEGTGQNVLNAFADAIEIKNLNLNFNR